MEQKELKILFFGDITGRQGRNALKSFLASSDLNNTFVIVNMYFNDSFEEAISKALR